MVHFKLILYIKLNWRVRLVWTRSIFSYQVIVNNVLHKDIEMEDLNYYILYPTKLNNCRLILIEFNVSHLRVMNEEN